jgi:DNA/RNA-binding domain of Phe-tRNA-synthetase-like protein
MLTIDSHPLLCAASFVTELPAPLNELTSPEWLLALHAPDSSAPVTRSEELRGAVRDLLRNAGYKPTGRGKPSSEYLVRAASEGGLPRINLVVDACNAVSLHSGLPISVVDLELTRAPLRISLGTVDTQYVFNASGQTIDVENLLCLFDADGPCANAVKDAQRTKTHAGTRQTLTVIWGVRGYEEHVRKSLAWYRELLERAGAITRVVD